MMNGSSNPNDVVTATNAPLVGTDDHQQPPQQYIGNAQIQQQQMAKQESNNPEDQQEQDFTPVSSNLTQPMDCACFLRCRGLPYSASENDVRKFFEGFFCLR